MHNFLSIKHSNLELNREEEEAQINKQYNKQKRC